MSGDRARRAIYLCPQIGTPDHDRCNALAAAGFEVTAIEWPAPKVYRWDLPGEARYRTRIFAGRSWYAHLAETFALFGLLLRGRPQLGVIYGYQHFAFFLAAAVLKCLGATAVSLNDSRFEDGPRAWHRDVAKWLMLSPYSAFLAASAPARDYLRYFGRQRIELYHCAIDTARIARDSEARFAATAFAERYFVAIARFEAEKNYFALLDGFELYARSVAVPRPLVICGYGSLETAIRARIAASEILRPLVRIAGYLPSAEIPALLGGAVALLLPSTAEVFGIVAVEALAAGVPAIVSSASGVADIVTNGGQRPSGRSAFAGVVGLGHADGGAGRGRLAGDERLGAAARPARRCGELRRQPRTDDGQSNGLSNRCGGVGLRPSQPTVRRAPDCAKSFDLATVSLCPHLLVSFIARSESYAEGWLRWRQVAVYVVIESRGKYWVDCEGRALGPYDEIADATDGAVHLAETFGDPARQLLVMVPDGLGHFDVAWEQDAIPAH